MLSRFAESNLPEIKDRTAKVCLLLPGAADPKEVQSLADKALAVGTGDLGAWFGLCRALALYRQDDSAQCIDAVQRAKAEATQDYVSRTIAFDLLLAMSHRKSGKPQQAAAEIQRAADRMEKDLGVAGRGDLDPFGIENWLICQILRREFEAGSKEFPATQPGK